jgi:hypothetical protein
MSPKRRWTNGVSGGLATTTFLPVRTLVLAATAMFVLTGFTTSWRSPQSNAPRSVINPAQARATVRAWSQLVDTAASNLDVDVLAQVEAPPLLDIDMPAFQDAKAHGASRLPTVGIANLAVYVPRQTSYPAQFLARLDGTNGTTNFFLFVKGSKQAPWRAAFQAHLAANAPTPDVVLDRRGYAKLVPERQAMRHLKFDPETLPRSYADFLNQSARAGAPASSMIFSPDIAQPLVGSLAPLAAGQRVVTYAPSDSPAHSYRTRDGGALSLVTATVDIQITADAGAVISPSQQLFDLRPGQRYQSEDLKGIDLVWLSVPPANAPALVTSPADYNAVISATGVPA